MFKSKEEKQAEKLDKFIEKYGLEDIDEKDMEILSNISGEILGLTKFGSMMTLKVEQQAYVEHLSVLVQQNWLIIKKLNEINNNLQKKEEPIS